jgi:hypothetical protein
MATAYRASVQSACIFFSKVQSACTMHADRVSIPAIPCLCATGVVDLLLLAQHKLVKQPTAAHGVSSQQRRGMLQCK